MLGFFSNKSRSEPELLSTLAAYGIRPAFPDAIENMRAEWGGKPFKDFESLLAALGDEIVDAKTLETIGHYSNDVWHYDAEAIEDHGDYARLIGNMIRLAQPALDDFSITDFVDIENEIAWAEVTGRGERHRIDFNVDNDWIDPKLFAWMNELLQQQGTERRFAAHALGQDGLVVCKTPAQIKELNRAARLNFKVE